MTSATPGKTADISSTPSGHPLPFEEAWARLGSENASLEATRQVVAKAKDERLSARAMYLPTLDLSASYTRIDDPIVIDLDPIRQVMAKLHRVPVGALPPFVEEVQGERFGRATLTASWVLFTGGKRPAANQAASARLQDAEAQSQASFAEVRSALVERYFGLRLAREILGVRRDLEEAMRKHAEEAKKVERAGLIAKAERLHAEVALADARMEARGAEHDVTSARAALAGILPSATDIDPTSGLFVVDLVQGPEDFRKTMRGHQPVLKRLEANRQLASAGLKAQRGRFLPDIYVYGQDEVDRKDLTILDPKWAVGVGVKFPLFEGGRRVLDTAAAGHQVRSVEALQRQTELDLEALLAVRYQEMLKARERFAALESTVELARENERVRTKAFESGMATSLEVTDAQLMLQKARLGRLVAAYDFDVALARLLEVSGQSEVFEDLRKAGTEVKP